MVLFWKGDWHFEDKERERAILSAICEVRLIDKKRVMNLMLMCLNEVLNQFAKSSCVR